MGLDNFKYIFSLPKTGQVLYNTVFISLMKIILGIVVPLVAALLLNEVTRSWYKRDSADHHLFSLLYLLGV